MRRIAGRGVAARLTFVVGAGRAFPRGRHQEWIVLVAGLGGSAAPVFFLGLKVPIACAAVTPIVLAGWGFVILDVVDSDYMWDRDFGPLWRNFRSLSLAAPGLVLVAALAGWWRWRRRTP